MPFIILRTTSRAVVTIACMLLSIMNGCNGDDVTKANTLNFDGHTRALRSAFLLYAPDKSPGVDAAYYKNILMLLSVGLTTNGHTMTGRESAIELSIYGVTQDLDAGTYTFTGPQNATQAFEMPEGSVQLDGMDTSPSPRGTQMFSFSAGQMTVTRSGKDYAIDIAGTVEGKILRAHFTGIMTTQQNN